MAFIVVEDREVLVLVVALIALVAVLRSRKHLGPEGIWACTAMGALSLALIATNVEEMVNESLASAVNVVEHLAYLAHTVLLLVFVYRSRQRSLAA